LIFDRVDLFDYNYNGVELIYIIISIKYDIVTYIAFLERILSRSLI